MLTHLYALNLPHPGFPKARDFFRPPRHTRPLLVRPSTRCVSYSYIDRPITSFIIVSFFPHETAVATIESFGQLRSQNHSSTLLMNLAQVLWGRGWKLSAFFLLNRSPLYASQCDRNICIGPPPPPQALARHFPALCSSVLTMIRSVWFGNHFSFLYIGVYGSSHHLFLRSYAFPLVLVLTSGPFCFSISIGRFVLSAMKVSSSLAALRFFVLFVILFFFLRSRTVRVVFL